MSVSKMLRDLPIATFYAFVAMAMLFAILIYIGPIFIWARIRGG